MTKPAMTWDEMHADPEFQMLSPAAQEMVRRQYLRSAGGPARSVATPEPKPSPLAPYLPKVPAKPPTYSAPKKESLSNIAKQAATEGFKQTTPGILGDKALQDARTQMPSNQKGLAQLINESQARRIDYTQALAPKPTLPQQVKAAAQGVADNLEGLRQNLTTGNEGLGEGVTAGLANVAGQLADPTALLTNGFAGKGAAMMVNKGVNPTLARGVSALGSGLAQGSAYSVAADDTQGLGPNALMAGLLNVATAGKAGNTVKTLARLKEVLPQAKSPKARARIEARIAELEAQLPKDSEVEVDLAPHNDKIIPFPAKQQPGPVARLVGDEAGQASVEGSLFLPQAKAVVDAVAPTFRDLIADESGQFDLDNFLRGLARNVNDLNRKAGRLIDEGRTQEAAQVQQQANDLRDVRAIAVERPATPADAQNIDATKYFNPSKYNFASNDAILKFDRLTREAVAERGLDPKQRIPQAEILRRAQEVTGERLDDLKNKKLKFGDSLSAVEYEAAKNTLQQLVEESTALEQHINSLPANTPPEVRQQMLVQLHQMEKDAKGFMDVINSSRSQKGRDLAYLKMVAQQGFSADYWLARAHRVSGGAVPPSQMSTIREIITRGTAAQQANDAAGIRQAKIDLAKAMGKLEQTGGLEALSALRKAGLLTGVKTIARNMTSNFGYQGLEGIVKMPAWGIDLTLSLVTHNRTVATPALLSPRKIAQGYAEVARRGVPEFGETMIHGMPLDQLANLEIPKEVNTGFAPFDLYVNGVFRFQSAQDRLFKAYAMKRSIIDQAELKAINELSGGQHGPDRRALAAHYAAHPTDEMIAEAIADADFMTFTNDTPLAKAITQGSQALAPRHKFVMDLIMPFKKTPLAVAERILQYAVLGQVHDVVNPGNYMEIVRHGLQPAQQRAIALGMSRGLVGSSLIMMGYWLAQNNRMTGTYEKDRKDVDQAAGRVSSAIRLGGQWVPIQAVSPVGNLLALGATLSRFSRDGLNAADVPGATLITATKTVLDQPMTQGMSQVADLAGDTDKTLPKFGASLAGSMVPTLAGEIAQSMDTVDRATSREWPDAAIQAMQKKSPLLGGRRELPEKLTPLGETIQVPSGVNAFNPFAGRPALEETNPVVAELVRINPKIPRTPDTLKARGRELALTPDLKREYQERVGHMAAQNIRQLLANPEYTGNEPTTQTEWMEDAFGDARQRVKLQMIQEHAGDANRAQRDRRHRFRHEEEQ